MRRRRTGSPTFMFISPQSELRTVLLWGNRWWFADGGPSAPCADPAQAAHALADHFGAERPPLRLVYQPDALASTVVACPQTSRALLAAALAADHPALADPHHAWGHEPV